MLEPAPSQRAAGPHLQQELSVLQNEECDGGQGFLFARPLEADAVEAFLQAWPESASSGSAPTPRTGGHAVIAGRR